MNAGFLKVMGRVLGNQRSKVVGMVKYGSTIKNKWLIGIPMNITKKKYQQASK
jgi:hypothetical protein